MDEADPDSSGTSESVDLKHTSSPLFGIPSLFVGFGAKDSDAGRSPTSPLDFSVFGGLFSPRSPSPSSPRFGHRNKWVCDKVGLSVLSSSIGQGDDSFRRENIVLAPQIKVNFNTTAKLSSQLLPNNIHPLTCDSITDVWDTIEHNNSPRRSSSSPMDIISSQAYSRDMALSEDYTCVISHGPNPKTTHIFGDCILDCDPKELGSFGAKEEIEKPKLPNFPDDSFSRLCLCTGKPQDCHMHSEASAEKKTEKSGVEDSLDISPGSSYNEEPMAVPLNP